MLKHLAIFRGDAIEQILSGKKRVDARFSQKKVLPFGLVSKGDVVLMKKPGQKILGQFEVSRVLFWDHPAKEEIEAIRKKYRQILGMTEQFWQEKDNINYLTLIFIGTVSPFLVSPKIEKKDLRGWVVLG